MITLSLHLEDAFDEIPWFECSSMFSTWISEFSSLPLLSRPLASVSPSLDFPLQIYSYKNRMDNQFSRIEAEKDAILRIQAALDRCDFKTAERICTEVSLFNIQWRSPASLGLECIIVDTLKNLEASFLEVMSSSLEPYLPDPDAASPSVHCFQFQAFKPTFFLFRSLSLRRGGQFKAAVEDIDTALTKDQSREVSLLIFFAFGLNCTSNGEATSQLITSFYRLTPVLSSLISR